MKIRGIEFRTDIEGLEKTHPPQPSNFYMPKWFKTMPSIIEQQPEPKPPNYFGKVGETAKQFYSFTVKKCPAIVDFLTQGYVIPFWCDMLIQRDHMMLEWDNKGFPSKLEFHDGQQVTHWKFKSTDFKTPVKFENPWRIYTPKGYSVAFFQPEYQFETRFTVLPGVVETDNYHQVHFPAIIHDTQDFVIKAGTPFMQVFPYKRTQLDLVVGQMTQAMKDEELENNVFLKQYFKESYRKLLKWRGNGKI